MKNKVAIILSIVGVIVLVLLAGYYIDQNSKSGMLINLPGSNQPDQNASQNTSGAISQTQTNANPEQDNLPPIVFKDLGSAPDFTGGGNWLNSDPLTLADLKGKVVLVDFWTYSCINCIRTLPYVTKWYDTYNKDGLVVIGVHTPEFDFEKETSNVKDAIKNFNIHYPVVQDNNYNIWQSYNNQYWPAEYLIDQKGHIVYTHFGEGNYDHTENAIRSLLGMNMEEMPATATDLSQVASPEMYFGTSREQYLTPDQSISLTAKDYTFPADLSLNNFAFEGNWKFSSENIESEKAGGKIKLKFHSGKLHLVAESDSPNVLHVTVDGKTQPDVTVSKSMLYTLFDSNNYTDHEVEITVSDPGFRGFTFTFG